MFSLSMHIAYGIINIELKDGWMDGLIDGWMDGWMDGWLEPVGPCVSGCPRVELPPMGPTTWALGTHQ